jgi:hypothetical protein
MLETAIVIFLAIIALIALQGDIGLPRTGGQSPELKYRRFRFRYSLWTLLLLMTLVALAIGIIVAAN